MLQQNMFGQCKAGQQHRQANNNHNFQDCTGCCQVLPSLLDFRPEVFGLPAFADQIEGTVRLDPAWRLRGTVVRGFGRGSKVPSACCHPPCVLQRQP